MLLKDTQRIELLDVCRGIAALIIVVHHALARFAPPGFLRPASMTSGDIVETAGRLLLWLPDRLNHEAVLFFFVLSGFCVHRRAAIGLASGRHEELNTLRFYVSRWLRLFPPLLTALLLTCLLDRIIPGTMTGSGPDLTSTHTAGHGVSRWGWPAFLGNLTFGMPFFVPPYGSNEPLWALGYEAWYYLLYPVWFRLSVSLGGVTAFCLSLAVGAASALLVRDSGFPLYPVLSTWWLWCLGSLLAELHARRYHVPLLDRVPAFWAIGAGSLLVAALTALPPRHSLVTYALWGPVLGFTIYKCAGKNDLRSNRIIAFFRFVGTLSYSIYVTHTPLLTSLMFGWAYLAGSPPHSLWLVFPGTITALLLGWTTYAWVEKPSKRFRSALQTALERAQGLRAGETAR